MLKIYEDKNYEDPIIIQEIKDLNITINRHAATLVLVCVVKMIDILNKICEEAI